MYRITMVSVAAIAMAGGRIARSIDKPGVDIDNFLEIDPIASKASDNNDFAGYNVTDATIRYQTRFGGLTLSAANLFNEFYIDYSSDTQRAGDNLRYYAGRGRVFTLGWDFRF